MHGFQLWANLPASHFIYAIGGMDEAGGKPISNGTLVLFDEGEQLSVSAAGEPLTFLLLTGKPLNEPVAWRGPIVMNTQEELKLAFQEYREGTFIKNQLMEGEGGCRPGCRLFEPLLRQRTHVVQGAGLYPTSRR